MTTVSRAALATVCALVLVFPAAASPQPVSAPDRVVLVSGDVLTGAITSRSDKWITLEHPLLGEMAIPLSAVSKVTLGSSAPEDGAAAPAPAVETKAEPEKPVQSPPPAAQANLDQPEKAAAIPDEAPKVKWSGRLELGANGSQGNSGSSSFYSALGAKRAAELSTLTINANYRLATRRSVVTTNRFYNVARFEWRATKNSHRSYFLSSTQEFDEFKDYNFRLTGSGGVTHRFINNDKTTLEGYIGGGGAREFGGSNVNFMPQAVLGARYTHKINSRVALNANGELQPRLDSVGEYRAHTKAAIDIDLSESGDLKLRLSVEDIYDSDPGAAKSNDVYYTASIVLAF